MVSKLLQVKGTAHFKEKGIAFDSETLLMMEQKQSFFYGPYQKLLQLVEPGKIE